jgi:hypothetical protein
MNDKQLLELAAKAVGFGAEFGFTWTESEYPRDSGYYGALWNYRGHMDTAELWNPLTDDGDALRLAVKLGLSVRTIQTPIGSAISVGYPVNEIRMDYINEHVGIDSYFATRRAIVRAAAEIGRMK